MTITKDKQSNDLMSLEKRCNYEQHKRLALVIQKITQENNISKTILAEELGITKSEISLLTSVSEKNLNRNITNEILTKLYQIYNVNPSYIRLNSDVMFLNTVHKFQNFKKAIESYAIIPYSNQPLSTDKYVHLKLKKSFYEHLISDKLTSMRKISSDVLTDDNILNCVLMPLDDFENHINSAKKHLSKMPQIEALLDDNFIKKYTSFVLNDSFATTLEKLERKCTNGKFRKLFYVEIDKLKRIMPLIKENKYILIPKEALYIWFDENPDYNTIEKAVNTAKDIPQPILYLYMDNNIYNIMMDTHINLNDKWALKFPKDEEYMLYLEKYEKEPRIEEFALVPQNIFEDELDMVGVHSNEHSVNNIIDFEKHIHQGKLKLNICSHKTKNDHK